MWKMHCVFSIFAFVVWFLRTYKPVDKFNPKDSPLGTSAPCPKRSQLIHWERQITTTPGTKSFVWFNMCYSLEEKVLLSKDHCKKFSFRDAQIIAFFQCVCHILLSRSTSDWCLSTKQTVSYPKQTSRLSGFIPLVFCFEHMKCHWDLF